MIRVGARGQGKLMCGGLDKWDNGGGTMALQENYVFVSRC
jgi:thiosulfate reductase/polysulfide reductase chain A